jgi:predicted NBD/HSP70 family sugar kinase
MDKSRFTKTDLNRSAILAQLGISGAASRTQLAKVLQISPAILTQLTKDLIRDGLIYESRTLAASGGRPATLLDLSSDAGHAIGIKVVADHLTFVEMKVDGTVLRTKTVTFDSSSASILENLSEETSKFIGEMGKSKILGVGVAVPGAVIDSDIGDVNSITLGWQGMPLGSSLSRNLRLPVIVENNVNAVAIAEQLYGSAKNYSNFLLVTLGTGIGLSIVLDGTLVRGSRGAAGELGHIQILADGPRCACGKTGCLESVIGQSALETLALSRGIITPGQNISDLADIARAGQVDAQEIFSKAATRLGTAVSHLANIFDPDAFVMLGEGIQDWDLWSGSFLETLRSESLPGVRAVPVVVENWSDVSWAQGAASLVLSSSQSTQASFGKQATRIRQRFVAVGGQF